MSEFLPIVAALPESPTPYLVMMLAGFVIAVYGHAMKSRIVVGLGIALIFLATALLPLAVTIFSDDPPGRSPSVPGSPG
ncbi:MAG: hypothetical protein ACR2OC_02140 [Solirubrobacterales bacterium]